MKNNSVILALLAISLLGNLILGLRLVSYGDNPRGDNQPTITQTITENPNPTNKTYENQYFKVEIPDGWTATEASSKVDTVKCDSNSKNCVTTTVTQPNPEAVNIVNGNYILYINTNFQQASGVTGGRFSEIAQGAPSIDAVIKSHPSNPCEETPAGIEISPNKIREDLFVSSSTVNDNCNKPTNGSVWYFSYVTSNAGGYINYFSQEAPNGWVATMSFNSKDVNSLPVKGDIQLGTKLTEMSNIVKTLEIK